MSKNPELSERVFNRIEDLLDGQSWRTLSELIGKSPFYLSSMKRAGGIPSLSVIEDICEYKKITLADFFARDYSGSKSLENLMQLISTTLDKEHIDKLYQILSKVNKKSIAAIIDSYEQYSKNI